MVGRSMQTVTLFKVKNQYPHVKQLGEALAAMKVRLAVLKSEKAYPNNDTILSAIKYLCPKQYEYVLLNYENRIVTYNLSQVPADKKTLDPHELMNELLTAFEEYREKSGAKAFEAFGDRPPQYHPYFAPRGFAGRGHGGYRGRGGRGRGRGKSHYQHTSSPKPTCYNCGKGNHYAKDCWATKSDRTKKWESRKSKGANNTEKGNSNNNNINNYYTKRQIADSKDKGKGKAPETAKTANMFAEFEEGSSTGNGTGDFAMQLLL